MPMGLAKFERSIVVQMPNSLDQIQNIQNQVHILIERYRVAIDELEKQSKTINDLTKDLEAEQAKGAKLVSEIEQLRLLLAFDGASEGRQALKKQLNEWVREIDKCVTLLNA